MVPAQCEMAIRGAEIVVCCAGITGGIGLAHSDPTSYVGPATAMACNVIDACAKAKVRLGMLSSTTVYAPSHEAVTEWQDWRDFGDAMRDDWGGIAPYFEYAGVAYSKRFLEQLCGYYHHKVGLEVAVVRPSGVYGRYDNFNEKTSHVIPAMIGRAMKLSADGAPFEIWGDGNDVRDFIHGEDVARGFLLAIAKKADADPINLSSGRGTTTWDLASAVLHVVRDLSDIGSHLIARRPDKPSGPQKRLISNRKAKELLGFEPKVTLREGLADTVRWRKEQAR